MISLSEYTFQGEFLPPEIRQRGNTSLLHVSDRKYCGLEDGAEAPSL